jgi:hypothetical protein
MKRNKIMFWITTGLFVSFMALGALPDILMINAAKNICEHLRYPVYLLPFLGVAKTIGAITIVIPKFDKLKEWAYAGLSINLTVAIYSIIQVDGFGSNSLIPVIGILLLTVSYIFWGRIKAINDKV